MNEYEKSHMKGAQLCLDNAMTLKGFADLSMTAKTYGLARSLFILSGEEAMKAHITASFAFTPEVDRNEFKLAFRKHEFKHDRIKEVVQMWHNAIGTFKEYISDAKAKFIAAGYTEEKAEMILSQQDPLVKNTKDAIRQYDEQKIDIDDMVKWWDNANSEKNNGLYVNTTDGINWHYPDEYNEEDALRAKKYSDLLLGFVYFFYKNVKEGEGFENMKVNKNATKTASES